MVVSSCPSSILQLKPGESSGPVKVSLLDEKLFSIRGTINTLVAKTSNWVESVWAVPDHIDGMDEDRIYPGTVNPRTGELSIHGLRSGWYTVVARSGRALQSDVGPFPPSFQTMQRVQVGKQTGPIRLNIEPNARVNWQIIGEISSSDRSEVLLIGDAPAPLDPWSTSHSGHGGRGTISGLPPGSYRVQLNQSSPAYI